MKSYIITDPKYYTNDIKSFKDILKNVIDNNDIDFICFRDKISSNYKELVEVYINTCKCNNIQNIYINQYIDLADKFNACGVHLTSKQFDEISYAKSLGLKVIISCHNELEINKAIQYNADYISYSPIFYTPNKGNEKGIENLSLIVNKYKNIKIFALGGIISKEHLDKLRITNVFGFSSIRYFINKD